jgi:ABC-2 type transport system ATP-binding protein
MPESVLVAHNLTKTYGKVRAVDSLSISINYGELVCLVGPDGAGKTSTLRLLCGLERTEGGQIELFGQKVAEFSAELRARIGYLSQNFSLYGDLSVEENLEFFAGLYDVSDYLEMIESLLEFTRLSPFRKRLAEQLSGGMKQKLALACTLVHKPDLLLLDEPTTGVDPVSRRDFWQILFRLQQEGKSILMSTPYLDEAERASRVAFIYQGKILAFDTPEMLKSRLRGRILEIVTAQSRRLYQKCKEEGSFLDVQLFGDRLHLVVPQAYEVRQLESLLFRERIGLQSLAEISPSLENIFIYLLKGQTGER